MSSYNIFSTLYDALTENVDYEVRSDYISDFFIAEGIVPNTIVDLACGTCSISLPFAKKGSKVIGVDLSEEMLSVASEKTCDYDVSLVCADITEFVYPAGADAVLCSLDSINHITNIDDVQSVFENAFESLNDNGIFIFDVNTIYKHQNVLFNNTFVFDEEDYYLVWDNEQVDDYEVRILLDFFLFNGESYDKYSEEFNERAYSVDELKIALNNAGFNDIRLYDELTLDSPKEDSERLYFVCKKV